jgi:hypothetical protein
MYLLILKTVVLSVLFIFIVHNIVYFFKENLTIPKTKDLVSITEKKYDEIYNIMKRSSASSSLYSSPPPSVAVAQSTTSIDDLPTNVDMKNELRSFLKGHAGASSR